MESPLIALDEIHLVLWGDDFTMRIVHVKPKLPKAPPNTDTEVLPEDSFDPLLMITSGRW